MNAPAKSDRDWLTTAYIKGLVFLLRACGVLLFIGYLISTAPQAWDWVRLEYTRSRPVEDLTSIVKAALETGEQKQLLQWIAERPAADRPAMKTLLEKDIGKLPTAVASHFSTWAEKAGNIEEAVFWDNYMRYRLRFDALRCNIPSAVEDTMGLLELGNRPTLRNHLKTDADLKKVLQAVMDYDAKHPAENDPVAVCGQLNKLNNSNSKPVDRAAWPAMRHLLRVRTEEFIRGNVK